MVIPVSCEPVQDVGALLSQPPINNTRTPHGGSLDAGSQYYPRSLEVRG